MRKLSFRTFLQRTLQNLSINDRTAPHQLAKELPENPRLLQPLCLYVALVYDPQQRTNLFRQFPSVGQEFARWPFLTLTGAALEQALDTMQDAENGYHKRWCSYVSVRDRQQADDHTKMLMHKRVRELQEQKHVSNYRIYHDLNLNPGNLNAWLTHQDCSKVSLSTARKTLNYLRQYNAP